MLDAQAGVAPHVLIDADEPVLQRPVEPSQNAGVHFTEHLALEGIQPSISTRMTTS